MNGRRGPNYPLGYRVAGKVTKVNTFLGYFDVDWVKEYANHCVRYYADFTKDLISLPNPDDEVEITNPLKFQNFTAVLGPESCISGQNHTKYALKQFPDFLKQSATDPEEIIAFDGLVRKLEPLVEDKKLHLCMDVFYENKISFTKLHISTAKDLQFANENSEQYQFLNFEKGTTFNVYPSNSEKRGDKFTNYLFGILEVSKEHGYFTLRDNSSQILVKFINSTDNDIYNFHNSLVFIEEFTVFTELFENKAKDTLSYLILDPQQTHILVPGIDQLKRKVLYGKNEVCQSMENMKYSFFLYVTRISEVIYGYENTPQCWLEASVNNLWTYVILPNELLPMVPFLVENHTYKVATNQTPQYGNIGQFQELFRRRELKKVLILSNDSIFQETDRLQTTRHEILNDFSAVKFHISNTSDYTTLSCILTVDRKEVQKQFNAPWIGKRHAHKKYFGEIDNCQDRLLFRDGSEFIDLYLTNRDNHVIPLGLVPEMKVLIKHVEVVKKKYLKATVFTRFEIVGYCPETRFSSVSLAFTDRSTWFWRNKTAPFSMGLYTCIPSNCVLHGNILFRAILELQLSLVCTKCRRVSRDTVCLRCNSQDKDPSIFMIVNVQDAFNPTFNIETDDVRLFLALVGSGDEDAIRAVKEICRHYSGLTLNVDFLKISDNRQIEDEDCIFQKMVQYIHSSVNYKTFHFIDVVCVRQVAEGRKPWKLVDFEMVP